MGLFRLKDKKTGQPITGLSPDISFFSAETGESETEHKHFFGDYYSKGEINLAKIQLFVLNSERGTIEVLDTFGNYDPRPESIKKLGAMTSRVIRLKGSPKQKIGDLLASRYGDYVYASIPWENQVAVVNTISHEVVKYIDTGTMPVMMFLQPGSKYLWVCNDDSVSIIDTGTNVLTKTIDVGKGYHQVAFSPENAYVTNSQADTVTVIRLEGLAKQKDIKAGRGPYGIGYSNASNEIYVANLIQGTVTVIDAATQNIKKNIPLSQGIESIFISPDGRRGVILNQNANSSYIIDAVNSSVIKNVKTGEGPNGVVFLEEYAIIRNTYTPDVTFININDPTMSNDETLGMEPALTWMPHGIVSTSYGDEAVITSPRDGKIWFMHKMQGDPMAMNSATVEYGADAVAIIENKLHETGPGIYQQYIVLDREGPYTIELRVQKINSSFNIEVLPDLTIGFQTTLLNNTFIKGSLSALQYQILDRKTGQYEEGLTDLIFVVVKPASSKGRWTKRFISSYIGNGTYEAIMTFSEEGEYMVTLTSGTLSSMGYRTVYDYVTVKNSTIR